MSRNIQDSNLENLQDKELASRIEKYKKEKKKLEKFKKSNFLDSILTIDKNITKFIFYLIPFLSAFISYLYMENYLEDKNIPISVSNLDFGSIITIISISIIPILTFFILPFILSYLIFKKIIKSRELNINILNIIIIIYTVIISVLIYFREIYISYYEVYKYPFILFNFLLCFILIILFPDIFSKNKIKILLGLSILVLASITFVAWNNIALSNILLCICIISEIIFLSYTYYNIFFKNKIKNKIYKILLGLSILVLALILVSMIFVAWKNIVSSNTLLISVIILLLFVLCENLRESNLIIKTEIEHSNVLCFLCLLCLLCFFIIVYAIYPPKFNTYITYTLHLFHISEKNTPNNRKVYTISNIYLKSMNIQNEFSPNCNNKYYSGYFKWQLGNTYVFCKNPNNGEKKCLTLPSSAISFFDDAKMCSAS